MTRPEPAYRLEIQYHNATSWHVTAPGISTPLTTIELARQARQTREIFAPSHSFRIIEIATGKVVK